MDQLFESGQQYINNSEKIDQQTLVNIIRMTQKDQLLDSCQHYKNESERIDSQTLINII